MQQCTAFQKGENVLEPYVLYCPGMGLEPPAKFRAIFHCDAAVAHMMTNPLRDHPAVAANKDYMYSESGVMHCLLAMERGGSHGCTGRLSPFPAERRGWRFQWVCPDRCRHGPCPYR